MPILWQSHGYFLIRIHTRWDRLSRVQAQIAEIAVGKTGAEPFVGDKDSDRSVARLVFYPKPVSAGAEA